MGEFSITHLLLLMFVVLIFFGPGRLPTLGKSLGEAIRGFKKGLDNGPSADEPAPPPVQQASRQVNPIELPRSDQDQTATPDSSRTGKKEHT